jgi:hypothetical protein
VPEPIYIAPAPRPAETPYKPPPAMAPTPVAPKEARKTPAPAPAAPPAAAVVPAPIAPSPAPAPARTPSPVVVAEPAPIILPEPEPSPPELRRFGANLFVGTWGVARSDGGGRTWDLAYGLRVAFAFTENIEADLSALRTGSTEGSPFVSTSATHNLFVLRGFWVWGKDLAFLAGLGGGVALAQTHYSLQPTTDSGAPPSGLDATAPKPVMEITAAGRWRFWGGLEARGEVSGMMRDGRLEWVPLLGLGGSF